VTYRDAKGRDWELPVTVSILERCRDAAHYDPLRLVHEGEMHRLVLDPVLLASLAWCSVEAEAKVRGVGRQEFLDAVHGDAIDRLLDAWVESFASFFPSRKAETIRLAASETRAAYEQAMSVPSGYGDGSTSSPASLEPILAA
jgi:hypothetical protein